MWNTRFCFCFVFFWFYETCPFTNNNKNIDFSELLLFYSGYQIIPLVVFFCIAWKVASFVFLLWCWSACLCDGSPYRRGLQSTDYPKSTSKHAVQLGYWQSSTQLFAHGQSHLLNSAEWQTTGVLWSLQQASPSVEHVLLSSVIILYLLESVAYPQ